MNAPTLTGTAGDKRNDLTWTSVSGAVKYRLRRAAGKAGYGALYTGPSPFANTGLTNGTTYHYRVRGVDAKGNNGPWSNVVDLTPAGVVVPPPGPLTIVGYGKDTVGGEGGTVYNVSTYAAFKSALLANGARIINIAGSAILDGGGDSFSVSNGDVTVDGTSWTGVLKNYNITWRCSNVIIREVAFRTGEGATASASADRRAISFNPPSGGTIRRILLDHCSFAWGPDVVASWLNNVEDMTVQHCIFGPALYKSNIPSSPNGYGISLSTTTSPASYPKRATIYRNLIVMCEKRNMRGQSGDWVEWINNVVYDAGQKPGSGNFQHATFLGNMIKKGPESQNNEGWDGELFGGEFTSFFADSIYFPVPGDTAAAAHANIGIQAGGGLFTLTRTFGGSSKRTAPYASAPTDAPLAAASEAEFAAVVNGAGRTHQDPIDKLVKQHALAGTSAGYYNGASGPAPHPSW